MELLEENANRFTMFPIKYPAIWEAYKNAQNTLWTPEEIDLSKDKSDWDKLSKEEQHFIKYILAFFAGSDGIVLENLATRFSEEVQIPEARAFYAYQCWNETVHSVTYSLLIDTYIKDEKEKLKLFNAIEEIPCIQEKAKWALKWIGDKDSSFQKRLFAFAVVEGIFFSGSFCAIYWIKKRGLLPGLTFSNELISRDERQHTDFAILLYSMFTESEKLTFEEIKTIVKEAVKIEQKFICDSLPCDLIGMNSKLMSQYIEYCADRLVNQAGYENIFNSKNPFDFMELISLRPKSNFFELRVGEYQKAKIETEFKISEDF